MKKKKHHKQNVRAWKNTMKRRKFGAKSPKNVESKEGGTKGKRSLQPRFHLAVNKKKIKESKKCHFESTPTGNKQSIVSIGRSTGPTYVQHSLYILQAHIGGSHYWSSPQEDWRFTPFLTEPPPSPPPLPQARGTSWLLADCVA